MNSGQSKAILANDLSELVCVEFSIIIPTFNSGAVISTAVQSVLDQTYSNFEILVIDGQSEDDTLNIMAQFRDRRIRTISEKDKGIYDAMNKGIEIAKGEYLYFMGSDDTLYNDKVLEDIYHALTSAGRPKVLYGNVHIHGSNKWVEDGTIHAGEFDLRRLLSHNISHQAIFYHRSVFKEQGKYNTRYTIFADHDMNLRCFANYPFVYTDIIVANFNVGGASSEIIDTMFEQDKLKNTIKYFHNKLFTTAFVGCRLFVKQAAFSGGRGISWRTRLYCMLAYAKLKTQAILT